MRFVEWQETLISQLESLFFADPSVQAVALFGSNASAGALRDEWSDVDVVVVVDATALPRYHPAMPWIEAFSALYTYEQSASPFTQVTRGCFRDGGKVDFVFTTTEALREIGAWPHIPWWKGVRVLFSRSEEVRAALTLRFPAPAPPLLPPEAFEKMARDFRFRALLAVAKVARNDLLIGLHLLLEMQQDYCVLGMILRDRAEGTAHHREGGIGNGFVAALQSAQFPFTADGLLDGIEQTARLFDGLAIQWDEAYRHEAAPLQEALAKARGKSATV